MARFLLTQRPCGRRGRENANECGLDGFGAVFCWGSNLHGLLGDKAADPSTVPKAVDVLTPVGVAQSDELDYTIHNPVTIAPVVVP